MGVNFNSTIRHHPAEDRLPFESGSFQSFFLMSFQEGFLEMSTVNEILQSSILTVYSTCDAEYTTLLHLVK